MARKRTIKGWTIEEIKNLTIDETTQLLEATEQTLKNISEVTSSLKSPSTNPSISGLPTNFKQYNHYGTPNGLVDIPVINNNENLPDLEKLTSPKKREAVKKDSSIQIGDDIIKASDPQSVDYLKPSSTLVQPQLVTPKVKKETKAEEKTDTSNSTKPKSKNG